MILLGTTYREVLTSKHLGPVESGTLTAYLREALYEPGEVAVDFEEFLDAPTSSGEYETGCFYLLEDDTDIDQMMLDTRCADFRSSYKSGDMLFDAAVYLNAAENVALLVLCTSDSGGNIYIVPAELFAKYPSLHEHIFEVSE